MPAEPSTPSDDGTEIRIHAGEGSFSTFAVDQADTRQTVLTWSRCHPEVLPASPQSGTISSVDRSFPRTTVGEQSGDDIVEAATDTAITAGRGRRLMFHAAGLADPVTGRTAALIAPSGTGKTTICATLGRRFGYITDETVIADPESLNVVPFPKPLSVLGPSGRRPKSLHSPDTLGLLHAPPAPTLHALVPLARDPTHIGPPTLDTLALGDGLTTLLPQTSSLAALDRGLVQLCRAVDRLGGLRCLRYAESDNAVELLDELLTADVSTENTPAAWEAVPTEELVPRAVGGRPPLRRPVDDAIHLSDGTLGLLHQERFTLLSGIGPALWESAAHHTAVEDLVADLRDSPDAPPDAEQLLRCGITDLSDRGLLTAQ